MRFEAIDFFFRIFGRLVYIMDLSRKKKYGNEMPTNGKGRNGRSFRFWKKLPIFSDNMHHRQGLDKKKETNGLIHFQSTGTCTFGNFSLDRKNAKSLGL